MIQKDKNGNLNIVGYARTNGEIGRILECLLEVGIFGKVSYLDEARIKEQQRPVRIQIPGKDLTPAKATHILAYMRRVSSV